MRRHDYPDLLKQAREASHQNLYAKALELCSEYINANPESPDGFRTRSHVYGLMGDFSHAIEDRSKALEQSVDLSDFFFRGWWNLECNQLEAALSDLTAALSLGRELNAHEFDQSAFFFRSVVHLRMENYSAALADSEKVGDDYLIYLRSGGISKADVVTEATSKLGSK